MKQKLRHEKPIPRLREEKPCLPETILNDRDMLRDISILNRQSGALAREMQDRAICICRPHRARHWSTPWLTLFIDVESLACFYKDRLAAV